jgi:transglutaminase-like putative cysteine protease
MRRFYLLSALFALVFVLPGVSKADSPPGWVKEALQNPSYNYDKSVPYLVLLDERTTTVKANGGSETRSRYIARILTQEGRAAARREIQYDSEIKISDLHAWHIRSDNKVFQLENEKVIEESINDDLFSQVRSKVMRFGEVDIGSVVAFEWVKRERQFVNQDYHYFQTRAPVVASRYQLELPEGWAVESFVFNHGPIKPQVKGNFYVWQVLNLPPIKEEPWMPEVTGLSPYLAVSYYPTGSTDSKKAFSTWQDVSRWAEKVMYAEARDLGLVADKAKELAAGLEDEREKVKAISRWVQKNIRYVSIQLSLIGGYRPNPADVVIKKGYGDCKDKSALMQAMLAAIGIRSYKVLVFSGDPIRVRPEFPSPLQFNHAVIAVEMKPGGLLFFDPTDGVTPLGDLPFYLQGSYGLVVNGGSGELLRLPNFSEEKNQSLRELNVQLQAGGEVRAVVKEVFTGQLASAMRRQVAASNAEGFERELAARVARDIPGAILSDLKINREADTGDPLIFQYTVRANSYANRMGKLLVIRPILMWVQGPSVFTDKQRQHPILFDIPSIREDITRISLPDGFQLDEVPSNTNLKTGFGSFDLDYKVEGRQAVITRRLAITSQILPPTEYAAIKKFFDLVQSTSQSSMVLVNQ